MSGNLTGRLTPEIRAETLDIRRKVEEVNGALPALGDSVTAAEGDIAAIQADVAAIEADVTALEAALDALPKGVVSYAKLTSSVTGINSETTISGLTQSFTAEADRLYKVSVFLNMQSGGVDASTIATPSRFTCYGRVKQNGTTIDTIRHDFRNTSDPQEIAWFFTATFSAATHEITLTMTDVANGTTEIGVYSGSGMFVEDIGLA